MVTQENTWAQCPSSQSIHALYSNEPKAQEATGRHLIFPRQRKDELSIVTQHHKRTTECRNSSGILPWPSSQTGSAGRGQIRSTTLQLPLSIVTFLHDFPSSSIHMAFTCLPQQKPVIHVSCPPPRKSFHDTS